MARVNFDAQLQAVLKQAGQTAGPYDARLKTLGDIAQSMQKNLTANPPIGQKIELTVTVEPGHSLNAGQQFNVMCSIAWRPFQSPLFRAYIPPNGDPVQFDFYGEKMVAANGDDEMQERVLDFIREPDVANRLLTLRQMATR